MLVIRGTEKVLDRLGGVTATDNDHSTTGLGDWYVNILFWKPEVALFVSEALLLPVLVLFLPAAILIGRFPTALLAHLEAHRTPRSFTEQGLGEMERRRFARPPPAASWA